MLEYDIMYIKLHKELHMIQASVETPCCIQLKINIHTPCTILRLLTYII